VKRAHLLRVADASLLSLLAACVIGAAAARAAAQTRASVPPASAPQSARPEGSDADEDFVLDIDRRHINEGNYHAETAVEADGSRGLRVGVGVALRASDIDVLLTGVRGRVRFRASLAPVLRLLDARRAEAPPASPPPPRPPGSSP
jgi:hypothetical protein